MDARRQNYFAMRVMNVLTHLKNVKMKLSQKVIIYFYKLSYNYV